MALREARNRRLAGWILIYCATQMLVGLAWDSTWHTSVGRDRFLAPQHLLMYSATGLAGLLCLGMVLLETLRYRRSEGVSDGNSVAVFRVFHAPLGIIVAGFGILIIALAAPLDNYWHTLYGIFVHLWTPFHMMGLIGGTLWGLGMIYLWASLMRQPHSVEGGSAHLLVEAWGTLLAAMLLLRLMLTTANPALTIFQTTDLGGIRFMNYPVLLTLLVPWVLVAITTATGRWGAATLVALFLLVFTMGVQGFVPWVVRFAAALDGRSFLSPSFVPVFVFIKLMPDFGVLLGAFALGMLQRVWPRTVGWRSAAARGAIGALPFWSIGTVLVLGAAGILVNVELPAGISLRPMAGVSDAFVTLPLVLAAGALSGLVGDGLGRVLRRNPR